MNIKSIVLATLFFQCHVSFANIETEISSFKNRVDSLTTQEFVTCSFNGLLVGADILVFDASAAQLKLSCGGVTILDENINNPEDRDYGGFDHFSYILEHMANKGFKGSCSVAQSYDVETRLLGTSLLGNNKYMVLIKDCLFYKQ